MPGARKFKDYGYHRLGHDMKRKFVHVSLAEKALGKPLPHGAEVHHVDGNGENNGSGNLVICPDRAYHMLLHQRQRALEACGHADWRKCVYCKQYDAPVNLTVRKGRECRHRACHAKRVNELRRKHES
jgi:hypothetical protein